MQKKMEELANKEYSPQYVHGADICTSLRVGFHKGFEARDKIAEEEMKGK